MTEQTALTERERELVAVGAAVGAGCQPCTQYHVKAALKSGLSENEVQRAIDAAEAVRREGGIAVSNMGRRILGVEEEPSRWGGAPLDRDGALAYLGAAAGCNAGSLLTTGLAAVGEFHLSPGEARSALEIAEFVKERAADFLRRDVDRVLPEAPPTEGASAQGCCGPEAVASATPGASGGEGATRCG